MKRDLKHITQSELKKALTYRDGSLYWKKTRCPVVNTGARAGTANDNGYEVITIDHKKYLSHRLIFLYHKGFLPKYIDHRDNNSSNNKIENLRVCNQVQNGRNRKIGKNNTSGIKGVSWSKISKKWTVSIVTRSKRYFGSYDDLELAGLVASEVRDKYHGEFANNGFDS